MSAKTTARVDSVAWMWKPAYWLYGFGLGYSLSAIFFLIRLTCRIDLVGEERLKSHSSCIFTMWHEENIPCFVSGFFRRTGRRFVLINHPAWSMKPVHLILKVQGVERLILGSTGHGGRSAADELVRFLKEGYSTHLNPDGPAGPPKTLKKGVAHIAHQSGAAIVPVRFELSRAKVFGCTWDGKRVPLPFSTIRIVFGEPMRVTTAPTEAIFTEIQRALC